MTIICGICGICGIGICGICGLSRNGIISQQIVPARGTRVVQTQPMRQALGIKYVSAMPNARHCLSWFK